MYAKLYINQNQAKIHTHTHTYVHEENDDISSPIPHTHNSSETFVKGCKQIILYAKTINDASSCIVKDMMWKSESCYHRCSIYICLDVCM